MSSGGGFSGGGGGYSGGFGPPMGGFGGGFGPPMGGFGQQFGGFQPPQYGGGFGQPFGGGFQQPQYGGGFGFQQPQFGGFQNQGPGNAYARQNPYQPPAPPPTQFGVFNGFGVAGGDNGFRNSPQQPPPGMEVNPDYQELKPGEFGVAGGSASMRYRPIQGANPATGILPSEPLMDPNAGKVKNPYYYDRFANGAQGTADVKFSDREYVSPEELNRFGTATSDMGMYDSMIRPAVMPSYGSPYGGFGAPYGGSPYMGMLGGLGGFFGGRGMPFNQGFAVPNQNSPVEATRFNPFNPADAQAQADAQKRQLQSEQMSDYQRLMARKNAASFAPSTGGLGLGGLQPINTAPSDLEIATSLGYSGGNNLLSDMRARRPEEYEQENAQRNAAAKDYLNSIGYGQAGFDPSKYEVRRQPTSSGGISSLFSGFGGFSAQ